MELNVNVSHVLNPITNSRLFNQLITTTNHYLASSMTRKSSSMSHGCSNTQFIYICSCILQLNMNFLNKNKNNYEIDDTINRYANEISIIYNKIKQKFKYSRSQNAIFNNEVDMNILIPINNIDDEEITSSTFYTHNNCDVIPLCMFHDDMDDLSQQTKYISHYFTIIINNDTNNYYINSSYGSDDICVLNQTKEIDKNLLNNILDKIIDNNFDEECEDFVKDYFLSNVDDQLFNNELLILKKSRVGLINNYISIITDIIRENPQLTEETNKKKRKFIGGKKKYKSFKKIKKYKNHKSKKYKSKKHKSKKYKSKIKKSFKI
jgi:hypothetical protein